MVSFIIDEQLPSLNDYINKLKSPNRIVGVSFKRKVDDICACYIMQNYRELKQICAEPVIIVFEWHEKSKRRDVDNVYSGKKYILDAMQKTGVLDNDNPSHVVDVCDSIHYGDKDYVVVTVIRANDMDNRINKN